VLGLCGCGAFTPRTAPPPCEPPTEADCPIPDSLLSTLCPSLPDFFEPITPEIVRDNIVRALEGRSVSCLPSQPVVQPNYERSLAPGVGETAVFAYLPDPGAEAQAPPGFFVDWQKPREVQFMLTLLESAGTEEDSLRRVELDFSRYNVDPSFPSTTNLTRYDVEYTLALTYTRGDPPQERTELYAGRARWDLIGGDRLFWTVLTWEDIAPLDVPGQTIVGTMGTLRALVGP
jgi:hypothetical protein